MQRVIIPMPDKRMPRDFSCQIKLEKDVKKYSIFSLTCTVWVLTCSLRLSSDLQIIQQNFPNLLLKNVKKNLFFSKISWFVIMYTCSAIYEAKSSQNVSYLRWSLYVKVMKVLNNGCMGIVLLVGYTGWIETSSYLTFVFYLVLRVKKNSSTKLHCLSFFLSSLKFPYVMERFWLTLCYGIRILSGSGSGQAKMTNKERKRENFMFWMVGGLDSSSVAWKSEVLHVGLRI
jgi:hypothetical protein